MKSYKRHLYIAATFIVLITAFVFTSINTSHSAPMADRDVRVINATTEPVPTAAQGTTTIAGNVSITNTPTVTAQQNGAWTVGISNTPTVQVGNTETNPVLVRDVDNPARQTFQARRSTFNFADPLITVPAGKRLVVEFVSGNIITSGTPALSLQAAGFGHIVVGTTVRSSDDNLYRFSQPLRMYVNAGESLFAESTAQFAEVSVTGYFIDVP